MTSADEHARAPLLWLLLPYGAGLTVAFTGHGTSSAWLALGAAAVVLASLGAAGSERLDARILWMAAIAIGALVGGLVWGHRTLADQPRWRTLPPREATLEVAVTRVFAANPESGRRSCLAEIVAAPALMDDLVGQRLYFSAEAPTNRSLVKTMRLRVSGVLHPLTAQKWDAGSFESYLVSSAVHFRLARTRVDELTRGPSPIALLWHHLGGRFESILRHGLPAGHPATRAFVAMFMGRRAELTEEQREVFLRSGTMHLFAISGLHIGVIAGCLHTLLAILRASRPVSLAAGLVLLTAFVEATGGTPSARRALFMVAVFWSGHALRRPTNPLAALATAALGVLIVDPLALLSTSFQLSYSVVAAILLYGSPLRNRWLARWKPFHLLPDAAWRWWHHGVFSGGRQLMTLVAISIAATLVSLPLGLGLFGLGSPGAVLSNVAVIPVAGLAVTAGFASIVCGMVGALPLSVIFNHAAAVVLAAINFAAEVAAAIPAVFFHGSFGQPWIAPAITIGALGLCLAGYATRWRRPPGAIWLPPLALTAAIVLLVTPGKTPSEYAAMKSAYELAMERLQKSDPDASTKLSPEEKARLAEIDRVYKGRIAEREIFLNQRLAEEEARGKLEEAAKIRKQLADERARLEEEREDEKNRVRRAGGQRA